MTKRHWHRRSVLQTSGVAIALPGLETFASTNAADLNPETENKKANRFVCIGTYLGFYQDAFFPKQSGRNYQVSNLLMEVEEHRGDFTVFSGLDHQAPNGHAAWNNFLCGQTPGEYSLDQQVADYLGDEYRFPSLQLSAGKASQAMSHTKQGIAFPMVQRPSVLYAKLFSTDVDRRRTEYLLRSGRSAMDSLLEDARQLQRTVSKSDQTKLNEYFESIREVERRMKRQLDHQDAAVTTDYQLPEYDPVAPTMQLEAERLMYDLMALALETDSTPVLSLFIGGLGQVFTIDGDTLQAGYHALSHHGNDPDAIRDLIKVEREHMKCFGRFLSQLKLKTDEQGRPLLDSTIVLLGTGMGDASRHANQNLPTLVAGGGFDHGAHWSNDRQSKHPRLLGDLYITLMQQLGMPVEVFSNSRRNLNEWLSS
ncbi:DUF1552 domain-containing protein [Rubripirellula sp.]|nr:DUF1552 domain-containing protein [Rubripirellula sp.]